MNRLALAALIVVGAAYAAASAPAAAAAAADTAKAAAAAAATATATPTEATPTERRLLIKLTPQVANGRVTAIAVSETFDVGSVQAGNRLLSLPLVAESVPGVLDDPNSLKARDAAGVLPLTVVDDPPDPTFARQDRHWHVQRATTGAITVSYRASPRVITPETRPAALLDMRTEGAGVYGSTRVLLALPESGWPRSVHVDWDLSAMAPGSRAVTSLGEGSTVDTVDAQVLLTSYFMAGPWEKLPAAASDGFMVYYLTPPDFDLASATRNAAATYRYASAFFGTLPRPFRALMRTTDRFQGGGEGGTSTFIFGTVKGSPRKPDDLDHLLTHEALHNWITNMPKGPDALWFVEGATDYYATMLPYRMGHASLDQVATLIRGWTTDYYGNPRRTMPESEATAAFWTDISAQKMLYARGPLYIALVDARLRAASGGRQRVDSLVRVMADAMRNGTASENLWLSLVTRALGEQGRRDFADLQAGRMLDLPEDLFGTCFRRVAGPVRRAAPGPAFDGFSWVLTTPRSEPCGL